MDPRRLALKGRLKRRGLDRCDFFGVDCRNGPSYFLFSLNAVTNDDGFIEQYRVFLQSDVQRLGFTRLQVDLLHGVEETNERKGDALFPRSHAERVIAIEVCEDAFAGRIHDRRRREWLALFVRDPAIQGGLGRQNARQADAEQCRKEAFQVHHV